MVLPLSICQVNVLLLLTSINSFIGTIQDSFEPNSTRFASPCNDFAIKVSVRCGRGSGCSKRIGSKQAEEIPEVSETHSTTQKSRYESKESRRITSDDVEKLGTKNRWADEAQEDKPTHTSIPCQTGQFGICILIVCSSWCRRSLS
jgi:hypothetical protein